MNAGQLGAYFQANKPVVIGVGAAAAVGLGLVTKRRQAAGGGKTAGAPSSPAGIVPGTVAVGAGYDSSMTDLYNALQPTLEQILQGVNGTGEHNTQTGSGGTTGGVTAPAPVSSPILTRPIPAARPDLYTENFQSVIDTAYRNPGGRQGNVSNAQLLATYNTSPLWIKQADGSYANQFGNTAAAMDNYGSPVQGFDKYGSPVG